MSRYGEVALMATDLVQEHVCSSPVEAWVQAAKSIFPNSPTSQGKSCPRGAFLGLCEEGLVVGVPAGSYTRSEDNKGYALRAVGLLAHDPNVAESSPLALWQLVMNGDEKRYNEQMDVVLALWNRQLIKHRATTHP